MHYNLKAICNELQEAKKRYDNGGPLTAYVMALKDGVTALTGYLVQVMSENLR